MDTIVPGAAHLGTVDKADPDAKDVTETLVAAEPAAYRLVR